MQSHQPVRNDPEDNVVPLLKPVGSKNHTILDNLKQIYEYFIRKNDEVEDHLNRLDSVTQELNSHIDELAPRTEAVAGIAEHLSEQLHRDNSETNSRIGTLDTKTRDLEARSKDLDSKAAEAAALTERLSHEMWETASSHDAAISGLEEVSTTTALRLDSLESKADALVASAEEMDSRTTTLKRLHLESELTDEHLAEEARALDLRISSLEPSHQALEESSRELRRDVDTAKINTDNLTIRFKQAAWVTGSAIVLLAVAVGASNWFGAQKVDGVDSAIEQQISGVRADLSGRLGQLENDSSNTTGRIERLETVQLEVPLIQQQIEKLQQQSDGKVKNSTLLRNEYQALSKDYQDLNNQFLTMREQYQDELKAIQERIYASDDVTQATMTDLSSLNSASWLQTQNPNHYLLQLVSVYQKQGLGDFINRYRKYLSFDQLSYFKTVHKGRDMFVLLYGNFGKFSTAMEKLEVLPDPLKKNRPYLRTMKSVQATIR